MKQTSKILSIFFATQIAFSCFALAVETSKKTTIAATTKSVVSTKKATKSTVKAKTAAKKSLSKIGNTTTSKSAIASEASKNKITMGLPGMNTAKPTTAAVTNEPKQAIETEVETIEQMDAAAKVAGTPVTPTSTSAAKSTPAAETKFLKYNISLAASYNTAAEAPKTGSRSEYMSYDILPILTTGPVKTLMWLKYNQNLVENDKSEWQDFPISTSLAKPYAAGEYITLNPAVVIVVPQTRATKDVAQLNYAANINLTIGLNSKTVGLDGMVLNWQTGFTKMNNEFTTSSVGEPLTSYRLRQRINFWYPIVENLTFKSLAQVDSNYSYENVIRNNFMHFVALEYRFLSSYNVNFGHANSGAVLDGPTYEQNFKFYDSKSSEYFLGLGADF